MPADADQVQKNGRQILLYGASHSDCVHQAMERRRAKGKATMVRVFSKLPVESDVVVGDTSFRGFQRIAASLSPEDVVVSMLGGRAHGVFGTVRHPRAFDFHTPETAPEARAGVEFIPFRATWAGLEEYVIEGGPVESGVLHGDGRQLKELRNATAARLIHVVPPPPPEDTAYIAKRHEREFDRQGIADLGVSPAELRLKVWSLQNDILKQFCDPLGIELLMPPPNAWLNGYLHPELRHGAIHGNERYGELVLQSIEERCLRLPPHN